MSFFKKRISCEKMADLLWSFDVKVAAHFADQMKKLFADRGHVVTPEKKVSLILEAVALSLWITSKALSSDSKVLDCLNQKFVKKFGGDRGVGKKFLAYRYATYYKLWDTSKNADKSLLAIEVLQNVGGKGLPREICINALLMFEVQAHINSAMQEILNIRKGFKIIA